MNTLNMTTILGTAAPKASWDFCLHSGLIFFGSLVPLPLGPHSALAFWGRIEYGHGAFNLVQCMYT